MSWFRVSEGRIRYRGHITQQPFTTWIATKEGSEAIAAVARTIGFQLFGRKRAARRRMWRSLDLAARSEPLCSAIQAEADGYLTVVGSLCYAEALPRGNVALRRLVVVPRAMIITRARSVLSERLQESAELAEYDGAVRSFFYEQLLKEMDRAVQSAAPSPRAPIHAKEWACIGIDKQFAWVDPVWSGPDWAGHMLMYEFPPAGISRRERKDLEAAIAEIGTELSSLSRMQRDDIVRRAAAGLTSHSLAAR